MREKKMKTKIDFVEGLGFFFEVLSFFLAGLFFTISLLLSLMFFICGFFLAFEVGKRIQKTSEKFKKKHFLKET